VRLEDAQGQFLAWGAYSPHSQIRARVWSWDENERIDESFFRSRLAAALAARRELIRSGESDALRLVHAESDGLPGLVADRYADTLVVQFLSSGAEHWRDLLTSLLSELGGVAYIYERSDVEVRRLEGLPERSGALRGAPPDRVQIQEAGIKFWVDLRTGHKTGSYLDQRSNRLRLRSLASGRRVLDCFCYTGGFTLNALVGGAASVLAVDSSADALSLGAEHLALNRLSAGRAEWLEGDVFKTLRSLRDQRQAFDLVVLDPPKFAPTASQANRAARGYKDINLLALKLLRPGGILMTFSCSGGIDAGLFQKIVAGAALDAGVQAQILERLSQGPDHPVALNFPEGQYLKGLVVRVA
jgi:23S rRNA (cytosine1962-C5)-methyltransferase